MNIEKTVCKNRCKSCGMCFSVCPVDAIDMRYRNGFLRPYINSEKCIQCGKCVRNCPAENKFSENGLMGIYSDLYLAHSADNEVRHNATSGGVINSLVRFLLEEKFVDGVMMAGYEPDSINEIAPQLITLNEVYKLKNNTRDYSSRYVLTPVLMGLKNIPNQIKKIAVIGTSCQIQALKLGTSMTIDIFTIGITCSGGISYKATEQYKELKNMPDAKMYYRGDGWPGKNCLISAEGEKLEYAHLGSLFEQMFSSQIFKNPGCRNCQDHFAEQADISFCDFWNEEERNKEHEGNSCVMIRSLRAKKYFDEMIEKKYIEIVRKLSADEVAETQMHVLKAKKGKLHSSILYLLFIKIIDVIFRCDLYKKFGIREYNFFSKIYQKLCNNQKL